MVAQLCCNMVWMLQVLEDAAKLNNVAAASGLNASAVRTAAKCLQPLQPPDADQGVSDGPPWPPELQAVLDQQAAMLSAAAAAGGSAGMPLPPAGTAAAGAGPAGGPMLFGSTAAAAGGSVTPNVPVAAGFSQTGGLDTVEAAEQLFVFSLPSSPSPGQGLNLQDLLFMQAPASSRKRSRPDPSPG